MIGYKEEFLKVAIQKARELENIEWEYEPYDQLVLSRVRMPGPMRRKRTAPYQSPAPTEGSKPHGMLQQSMSVGKTQPPIKVEGIN